MIVNSLGEETTPKVGMTGRIQENGDVILNTGHLSSNIARSGNCSCSICVNLRNQAMKLWGG